MKLPIIRNQFKPNIYAHATTFIINIGLYVVSQNLIFVWIQLAALSFIGTYNAKSHNFFDRNIFNHFVSVMCYYLLSMLIGNHREVYVFLVFGFTYVFFILRNNGYNKSLNLWMYIQALLIGSTFTSYPFQYKIYATVIAYIEAQLILYLAFRIKSNDLPYEAESRYLDVIKLPIVTWCDSRRPEVILAIRGALTAAVLYSLCVSFDDIKPNWAVVTAVSCLQRDDYVASLRAIKGVAIGTIIGWPISYAVIYWFDGYPEISTIALWTFMLVALTCSFELSLKPKLILQIASALCFLLAATCVSISLQVQEQQYLSLKVLNSLIGVSIAYLVLQLWQYTRKQFMQIKTD